MENYRFTVEPLGRPDAGALVTAFSYDFFRRRIYMTLSENSALDASRWLVAVKDIYDQANCHPNLKANDIIVLRLFDGDKNFSTIRFAKLLVEDHIYNASLAQHTVSLGFERFEIES